MQNRRSFFGTILGVLGSLAFWREAKAEVTPVVGWTSSGTEGVAVFNPRTPPPMRAVRVWRPSEDTLRFLPTAHYASKVIEPDGSMLVMGHPEFVGTIPSRRGLFDVNEYEAKLRAATTAAMRRRMGRGMRIQVGAEDWQPSEQEMQDLVQMVMKAEQDREGEVVVRVGNLPYEYTRYGRYDTRHHFTLREGFLFINSPIVDGKAHIFRGGKGAGQQTSRLCDKEVIKLDRKKQLYGSASDHACPDCIAALTDPTTRWGDVHTEGERVAAIFNSLHSGDMMSLMPGDYFTLEDLVGPNTPRWEDGDNLYLATSAATRNERTGVPGVQCEVYAIRTWTNPNLKTIDKPRYFLVADR